MDKIFRKKGETLFVPVELNKTSILYRVVDVNDKDLAFPGRIVIKPTLEVNLEGSTSITWSLYNITKNIKVMDGIGDVTLDNMEPALYKLDYNPVSGYKTPKSELKYLNDNGEILFSAVYIEGVDDFLQGSIIIKMNVVVGGWIVEYLNDDDDVLFTIPTDGKFSNLQVYNEQNLPFGKYRLVLKQLGTTEILTPTESNRIKYITPETPNIYWDIQYESGANVQANYSVNLIPEESVVWRLEPKYRPDNWILSVGSRDNVPVFVEQDNEVWKFAIVDEANNFKDYVVSIKSGLSDNLSNPEYIFRENDGRYLYGYDSDKLKFRLNENNIIRAELLDTTSRYINRLLFLVGRAAFFNTTGFAPKTDVWYDDLEFDVTRYDSDNRQTPSNTQNVVVSPPTQFSGTFDIFYHETTPPYIENSWTVGLYKIDTNKPANISVWRLREYPNIERPDELYELIYKIDNSTTTDFIPIFYDGVIVVDISKGE